MVLEGPHGPGGASWSLAVPHGPLKPLMAPRDAQKGQQRDGDGVIDWREGIGCCMGSPC